MTAMAAASLFPVFGTFGVVGTWAASLTYSITYGLKDMTTRREVDRPVSERGELRSLWPWANVEQVFPEVGPLP